jgi:hypothetical protein
VRCHEIDETEITESEHSDEFSLSGKFCLRKMMDVSLKIENQIVIDRQKF